MNLAFVCHAPADRAAAEHLGAWLEANTPCRIAYTQFGEGTGFDLVEAVEQSIDSAAVVVLLSSAAVPQRLPRKRWDPALLTDEVASRVAYLRLSDSKA